MNRLWKVISILSALTLGAMGSEQDARVDQLVNEIANKGWIAYSARSDNGTWDIFFSRPDGSQRRNISNTADYEEAAPLFSCDGKRMLYRRIAKGATINHDLWGFQGQLILADADGGHPQVFGKDAEYAWASWSPDAKQILCLTRKEIQIVNIADKKIERTLPRKGIYQQLFWSADGQWFTGTGNIGGQQWCVVRMNAQSGVVNPVIIFQSCTPDWFPDSKRVIFSSRPANQSPTNEYGWTQLYAVDGDGQNLQLIYGEDGNHIYSGSISPDGKYVLFTKCPKDGGASEESGAPICVMRMDDAPSIGGESKDLRRAHPQTKDGPILTLTAGWEPCWTYAELGERK
ncbi:MAG: hypothetical protein AB1656_24155 [Candidatus Omnitrophota bacterium]